MPGTGVKPGQGNNPIVRGRFSTSGYTTEPVWSELDYLRLRSFSIRRGRDSELSEFDVGTATITVNNRDRALDPGVNAAIRPMNRWWLYAEWNGRVVSLFKGYAESYEINWPNGGWSDAELVVTCGDELKPLGQFALPSTNPPRDTYGSMLATDLPDAYWAMNEDPSDNIRIDSGEDVIHDFFQEPIDPPPLKRAKRSARNWPAVRRKLL